jgi:hypothetical protein
LTETAAGACASLDVSEGGITGGSAPGGIEATAFDNFSVVFRFAMQKICRLLRLTIPRHFPEI